MPAPLQFFVAKQPRGHKYFTTARQHRPSSTIAPTMPSIAQTEQSSSNTNLLKRRRDDELSVSQKRARCFSKPSILPRTSTNSTSSPRQLQDITSHTLTRKQRDLKRPRHETEPQATSHEKSESTEAVVEGKVDLRSCHVCRRKPALKSELDAFGDCESCERRTCFVCMRQCLGEVSGEHRATVCSRCCVERGVDGEVLCLGCLRAVGDS